MKRKSKNRYDDGFYLSHSDGVKRSANVILGVLYQHYTPRTVIDVGCGQGTWLAVAESLGAKTIKGLDGEWVNRSSLASHNISFEAVDFEKEMPQLDGKYELCISLEVAEHISEGRAEKFISLLCGASDVVLFSAAIKNQGGRNHVNEQWQSYWIKIFEKYGFVCHNFVRDQVWNNQTVEWWYRQNLLLFCNPDSQPRFSLPKGRINSNFNVVHPENYESKIRQVENPSMRFCLNCIGRYFRNRLIRARKLFYVNDS